jgi:CHRD domain
MQNLLIFTANHATMKLFKLTVLASLCFALFMGLSSCEKDSEKDKANLHIKTDIPVTGAQIVPASPSPGTGKLSINYDRRNKVLNYTITWTGLSDSVVAIRINGPAPSGFSALNTSFTGASPTLYTTTPYIVIQQFTGATTAPFKPLYPSTGSFSGTLSVDGVKVKEQDLLNNLYYFTIHTKTVLPGSPPASLFFRWYGEIRAQINFQ